MMRLLADPEFANNLAISVGVALLQVIEQAAALANEHQKSAA
jgi:hypothetical protein